MNVFLSLFFKCCLDGVSFGDRYVDGTGDGTWDGTGTSWGWMEDDTRVVWVDVELKTGITNEVSNLVRTKD